MATFAETPSFNEPPHSGEQVVGINKGNTEPYDPHINFLVNVEQLDKILSYGLLYRGKGQPDSDPTRVKIMEAHLICEVGGTGIGFACDRGVPGQTLDPISKKMVSTWTRQIGKNPDGQPVFSDFHMAAWRFFETQEPDFAMHQITDHAYGLLLEEHRPLLERFKALSEASEKQRSIESERIRQARESKMNPTQSMAAAISEGVARALSEMNLVPKKKTT